MNIRIWGAVVLLLAGLVLSGGQAFADPQLPPRTGSIVDLANLLEPFQEQPLARQFATLKARNGVDFVVVTLPSLQGYPIETWGRLLGNGWNVGGKSGLGALLIVAPNDREVRIEIGDALSVMFSDRAAASIIDGEILPSFREGRMSAGIIAGVNAMIYQANRPLAAQKSDGYAVEGNNAARQVETSSRIDLSWLRSYLPSQGQVMGGLLILVVVYLLYKTKFWRWATEPSDFSRGDYTGRTVYRSDRSSSWHSSSWDRHDHNHRGSGGFGGFGSSGGSSGSSRQSGSSGSSSSRSSGGFSGSGSSRSFGGSSGGRSSGGGSSGRGASGRW